MPRTNKMDGGVVSTVQTNSDSINLIPINHFSEEPEETLRTIAEGTSSLIGEEFFRSLTRHFATVLKAQYAFITKLSDSKKGRARTLTCWMGKNFGENFEYDLAGTPCAMVIKGKVCLYPKNVQALFPEDEYLIRLRAESYLGIPLFDSSENVLGHLTVINDKPMDIDPRALAILRIFAARAGAELEREQTEKALRESQEKYSALTELSLVGVFSTNLEGECTYVNQRWVEICGLVAEEALGFGWTKVLHPDDREVVLEQWRDALKTRDVFKAEYRFIHSEGKIVWVYGQVRANFDEDGNLIDYIGSLTDITERKETEEALRNSQELYRALYEDNPAMCFSIDANGKVLSANKTGAEQLGYTVEELIGKSVLNVFYEDDKEAVEKQMKDCLKAPRKVKHWEIRKVKKDGTIIWVQEIAQSVHSSNGQPIILLVGENITDRKQTEGALKASEEKYRTLFESSRDAIFITTQKGKFVDFNHAALKIFGYSKEELLSMNVLDFYSNKRDRQRFREQIQQQGYVKNLEHKARAKDGSIIYCEITSVPRRSEDGSIVAYQTVLRNITERKKALHEIENSREQLQALSAHLHVMTEKERVSVAREVHDGLGGILTSLKINLTVLERKIKKSGDFAKMVPYVKELKSMKELIDASFNEIRHLVTKLRPVLLDNLGLMAAVEWQIHDFQKRTGLPCQLKTDIDKLSFDETCDIAVFRIFQEALTNISRHAKANKVIVKINKNEENVYVEIVDDGIGVPKEKLESANAFGLLGMRERAFAFGGEVDIKGTAGKGSTVKIKIPIT